MWSLLSYPDSITHSLHKYHFLSDDISNYTYAWDQWRNKNVIQFPNRIEYLTAYSITLDLPWGLTNKREENMGFSCLICFSSLQMGCFLPLFSPLTT
jgi:hypothetical protein